jgi:hypothetical protein
LPDNGKEFRRTVNSAAIIGTVHLRMLQDKDAAVIYLTRDRRDQVLSITFRKNDYGKRVVPEMNDRECLRRRCRLGRVAPPL